MREFEKQKEYAKLIAICNEQIRKTPVWLTPYLYLGMAYYKLGNRNEAIKMFKYVKENSFGDPAYSQANELIEKLTSK